MLNISFYLSSVKYSTLLISDQRILRNEHKAFYMR